MWRGRGAMLIQLFCLSSPSQPSPGSPAPNTCSEPTAFGQTHKLARSTQDLAKPNQSCPPKANFWSKLVQLSRIRSVHPISTYIWIKACQYITIGWLASYCFPNLHWINANTFEFVPISKTKTSTYQRKSSFECVEGWMGLGHLTNRGMYDREEVSVTGSAHAPAHLTNPSSTYHPRVGGANGQCHWPTLIRPIASHTWCCIALATNFWQQ